MRELKICVGTRRGRRGRERMSLSYVANLSLLWLWSVLILIKHVECALLHATINNANVYIIKTNKTDNDIQKTNDRSEEVL